MTYRRIEGRVVLAARETLENLVQRIKPLWRRLADPLDTVLDPAQRRQARLLNALLVPVFASLAFLMLWGGVKNGILYLAVDFFVLLIIYLLNRIGLYIAAALALSLLISAAAFANALVRASLGTLIIPASSLMWLIPGILIAYLLLPLRATVVVLIANLVGILLVPPVARISPYAIVPMLYFTAVISLLILIAVIWRSRYIVQLEQHTREVSESEERFRNLLAASFETVVVHKNGTIIDVNPAVEQLLGYTPQEVMGRPALDFIDPRYHEQAVHHYETNYTEPYEVLLRHKNGTALHAELRGKQQWYRGELVRVVAARDITELKHQEELTIEREKVRVLQKFIGDLSHDLRTPLSVINTSIYLIERMTKEPERQQQQLAVLQEQAVHIQRLLEDLLSMARLDKADTSDFKLQWQDVNALVKQAVEEHQNMALRKRQTLVAQLSPNLPDVLIDSDQIMLALKHLILNGLSYTGSGGGVTVETLCNAKYVMMQVRDNGAGIEQEDMPHIFERFYRGNPARGENGGTGIGLTIAKKIVEAHRGKIEAESDPGRGSVFRILLPRPPQ